MTHIRYQTEGIILECLDTRESDKYIHIFTEEFGLIRAVARSVRKETSKLRYSLQLLSRVNLSLVKGRDVWRIVGAEEIDSFYTLCTNCEEKKTTLLKITLLLKRLVQGEEANKDLYDSVISGFLFVGKADLSKEELQSVEYLTVLRILYSLGYVSGKDSLKQYLDTASLDRILLEGMESHKKGILSVINKSLKETQL